MKRLVIVSGLFAVTGVGAFALASSLASAGEDGRLISHDRFSDYVADAEAVFGPVEFGDSCNDWPDRAPDELAQLAVLPAVGEGADCRVIGWAYASPFTVIGLPDAATVRDGQLLRPAVFDAEGSVISHFDSAESAGGSLTPEQLAELGARSDWSGAPQP